MSTQVYDEEWATTKHSNMVDEFHYNGIPLVVVALSPGQILLQKFLESKLHL